MLICRVCILRMTAIRVKTHTRIEQTFVVVPCTYIERERTNTHTLGVADGNALINQAREAPTQENNNKAFGEEISPLLFPGEIM